jgi:NADH-quinone oxidoreductase subunit L
MYSLILYFPLFSAVAAGLFGRKLGEKGAGIITTSCIMITCALSYFALYENGLCGTATYVHLWT